MIGLHGILWIRFVKDPSLATGCCAAIVRRDGQRCLAAHIGAAGHFDLDYLNSVGGLELIDRCRILLVEGFFAHHSPDVAMAALRRADSRGGTVRLLTLSALYICLESHALLRYSLFLTRKLCWSTDIMSITITFRKVLMSFTWISVNHHVLIITSMLR